MSENQQSLPPPFVPRPSVENPSWKGAYEKTRWELDTEKLLTLVHATEAGLFLRWQELEDVSAHGEECAAMEAAAKDLLAIKIHKLGWPDPCL
jgi:hypothetical protein